MGRVGARKGKLFHSYNLKSPNQYSSLRPFASYSIAAICPPSAIISFLLFSSLLYLLLDFGLLLSSILARPRSYPPPRAVTIIFRQGHHPAWQSVLVYKMQCRESNGERHWGSHIDSREDISIHYLPSVSSFKIIFPFSHIESVPLTQRRT